MTPVVALVVLGTPTLMIVLALGLCRTAAKPAPVVADLPNQDGLDPWDDASLTRLHAAVLAVETPYDWALGDDFGQWAAQEDAS